MNHVIGQDTFCAHFKMFCFQTDDVIKMSTASRMCEVPVQNTSWIINYTCCKFYFWVEAKTLCFHVSLFKCK